MPPIELECQRCDYTWIPKKDPNAVQRCPECKSTRWDRDPETKWSCPFCGVAYESKVACSSHIRRKGDELHGRAGFQKGEPAKRTPPRDV